MTGYVYPRYVSTGRLKDLSGMLEIVRERRLNLATRSFEANVAKLSVSGAKRE